MSFIARIKFFIRSIFSPGAAAFDEWRGFRTVIISVLIGIVLAAIFGFALYRLNTTGRLH